MTKWQKFKNMITDNFLHPKQKTKKGYIKVYRPYEPNTQKNGYIYEHRYNIQQEIGRPLEENEIVHHKNGIKNDNKIKNLQITNRQEHYQIEKKINPEIKKIVKYSYYKKHKK
ncbi:MAG: HNH endonuclease [Clostridiales bacterium]|jgi:hypothetical protein|nr:HNH endonuclease [Clostridiales bacterium]